MTPLPERLTYRLSIRNNGVPVKPFWYTPAVAGCDAVAVMCRRPRAETD